MAYRYLGNKSRLADWLLQVITGIVPQGARVADPMCGTAAVSVALARAGYSVTASDALTFPVIHARVRLLLKHPPAFAELGGYDEALRMLNELEPVAGYFAREFGSDGVPANGTKPRRYFSAPNASKIDAIRSRIESLRVESVIDDSEHDLLLHTLIMAVNDVANIAGTYGYYRSAWSPKALTPITLKPVAFSPTPGEHQVFQGKVEDLAAELSAYACYLDPPYTKRQYAGQYHVLETLALQDEPIAVGEGGLRDWSAQSSDFCLKRYAGNAFREVLKRLDLPHLFVSYSEDGQLRADELETLLEDYGTVTRHTYPLARYRSNQAGRRGEVSEFLYHVEAYA